MGEDTFEVAFSGEMLDGTDPEQVKANVARIFKADAAKLEHLFSGKRVVIKKNISEEMATKYQLALKNAGAICEVKDLAVDVAVESQVTEPLVARPVPAVVHEGDIPPAPNTVPLHITADEIAELATSLAPVGSAMQENIHEAPPAQIDTNGMDMAPVGSDLGVHKEEKLPPPPDTSGITLVDN
ncbi:MAG: hypothetical protein OEY43_03935 [Gammaproteobacteria bacterium]|nr:hypothetical protein [Gammaproteobacteria bacterium]